MKLSRYKRSSELSYTLGATLVYELLKTHPELIRRVFLRPNIPHGADLDSLLSQLRDQNIEILESAKAFNVLDAKGSCLLIAEFTKPSSQLNPAAPHLVLINPSDAGNLGTIMRSAAAFGFTNLAIITPAVDPYQPKTIRASMGAIFHLNLQEFTSYDEYLASYGQNRACYAFMLDNHAIQLPDLTLNNQNFALIFGNEASGLPSNFATKATPVYIPQSSNVDSLNLSVATSIALYQFHQK
jgi:TrmH family RNA methyltransferase